MVNARFAKPLDEALMHQLAERHDLLITLEDHSAQGGFGSAVMEALEDVPTRVLRCGLPDRFIDHGKRELLLEGVGLAPDAIVARAMAALRRPAARILSA